ncbi:MAG: response regulator transcription factor [Chloroflexota bacterium]|nr:response regulator transcription factor [Chloroflexota bacterium]
MIDVLLVDDHASFRGALAFMLEREEDISVVAQAGSLAEARTVLANVAIAVALVDLDLPDGHGLDLLTDIRQRNPEAPVLILTGSIRAESRAMAVASGASGFLHKSTSVAEIVTGIRRVAAGQPLITPAEAITLMSQARLHLARTETSQRALRQLTPRERDVLRALAAGLDNQAIADRLHLGTATVRSHVVQVLRKLEVDSRLQAALFAVRHGVVDEDSLT